MRAASKQSIDDPRVLTAYHETLLFLAAYPDDRAIWTLANRELRRLGAEAKRLVRSSHRAARVLENSGIAGTEVVCSYSIDLLAWMVERFSRDVEFDWDDESLGDEFDEFLPNLASRVEADGLMSDQLSTRGWMRRAKGRFRGTDLAWVVRRFQRCRVDGPLRDRLFDSLELRVRWRPAAKASRTLGRLPNSRVYCHADGILRLGSLRDEMERPLPRGRPVVPSEGRRLMDTVRAALAVRERETDAGTYPQFGEVYHWRLDRGFEVVLHGMAPARRLPIESFFGFMLAKNGIPLGYGGGWVFFDRCEVGVNIFDTFRGGESAFGFAQVIRVYRQLFRARRFTVDPYQFGQDNTEAIKSGAFWFYYRLGFRPLETKLAFLAADEWSRITADRTHRSSPSVLRRLARAHIALDVDSSVEATPDLKKLSLAATKWIGRRFAGDRETAEAWCEKRLARVLGVRSTDLVDDERDSFRQLGMLVAMIDDLPRWSKTDRAIVANILRAKGGSGEVRYANLLQRHDRLRRAWSGL